MYTGQKPNMITEQIKAFSILTGNIQKFRNRNPECPFSERLNTGSGVNTLLIKRRTLVTDPHVQRNAGPAFRDLNAFHINRGTAYVPDINVEISDQNLFAAVFSIAIENSFDSVFPILQRIYEGDNRNSERENANQNSRISKKE